MCIPCALLLLPVSVELGGAGGVLVPRFSAVPEGELENAAGSFRSFPAALLLHPPSRCKRKIRRPLQAVKGGAPDGGEGGVVGAITRLCSRMDDTLAEGQSAAPRELLICLLNLSSGGSKLVVVVIGELAGLLRPALCRVAANKLALRGSSSGLCAPDALLNVVFELGAAFLNQIWEIYEV